MKKLQALKQKTILKKNIFPLTASIMLIPGVYLIYNISNIFFNYLKSDDIYYICNAVPFIQTAGLFLFIEIIFLAIYKYKSLLINHLDISIVFLMLIIFKIFNIIYSDITITATYLLQVLLYSALEILPILFLYPLKSKNFALKVLYISVLLVVTLISLSQSYYYYITIATFRPIIFDNFNIYSINAFMSDSNWIFYSILIVYIVIISYSIKSLNKKRSHNLMTFFKKLVISITLLFVSHVFLSNLEKIVFSNNCRVYGITGVKKNKIVNVAVNLSYVNLLQAYMDYGQISVKNKDFKFKDYSIKEKNYLKELNLLSVINPTLKKKEFNILKYKKIIFITFESLSIDYINFYNKKIPEDASYYFDYLLNNYTHFNNYYTSNMPTQQGLNAMINSKLVIDYSNITEQNRSLFSLLRQKGYDTYFIKGISKFYGRDQEIAEKLFQPDAIIALEELVKDYGSDIYSLWGVHDNSLYSKSMELLLNNKSKVMLFIKTIDFHPPAYSGDVDFPKNIVDSDRTIKSIYWLNMQLEIFVENLKNKGLFDDETIIFITSDHNPFLGAEYKEYAIKSNYSNLSRIPLIVLTSKPLHLSQTEKYFSQIDLLPTIFNVRDSNSVYTGRNILKSNNSFAIGIYDNEFYYNSKDTSFTFDLKKCFKNELSPKNQAICKYLYNTKNIQE